MAIQNSFFNLDEAPDRYGVDVQTLPNKKEPYKLCDCGNMIHVGEKYWDFKGTIACVECLHEVMIDFEKEAF